MCTAAAAKLNACIPRTTNVKCHFSFRVSVNFHNNFIIIAVSIGWCMVKHHRASTSDTQPCQPCELLCHSSFNNIYAQWAVELCTNEWVNHGELVVECIGNCLAAIKPFINHEWKRNLIRSLLKSSNKWEASHSCSAAFISFFYYRVFIFVDNWISSQKSEVAFNVQQIFYAPHSLESYKNLWKSIIH